MGNIATNVNNQISLLKSRGLNFEGDGLNFSGEEKKAKEILLDIGYYRLGFYWYPFEKICDRCKNNSKSRKTCDECSKHYFENNSMFADAVDLYYLDVDLRNLLLQYINRIEINFRTKLIYYVSNKYKSNPTWFVDSTIVNNDIISKIKNDYADLKDKKHNKYIKDHHLKYPNDDYAPAWKTIEFLTFGTIIKLYKGIKNIEIKKRISNEYGILNEQKLVNFINTIVFIRNSCAHGRVLFDLKTPKGISIIPEIDLPDKFSLYSSIKVILFILEKISSNRATDMKNELSNIFNKNKHNSKMKNIIENSIMCKFP